VAAERGRQAREAYYDAVFVELAARGYQGLTVEGIVRRAGGSRGRFYHHFDNKRDALVQAYRAHTESTVCYIEEALAGGATVEQAITADVTRQLRRMPASLVLASLEMHLMAARDNEIRDIIMKDYEAKLRFCEQLFRRGIDNGELRADVDPVQCAHFVYSCSFGVYLVHFGTGAQDSLIAKTRAKLRLLFDALRAAPSRG